MKRLITLVRELVKNMEEYSRCCGVIEGLALAERELLDMVETIEEN